MKQIKYIIIILNLFSGLSVSAQRVGVEVFGGTSFDMSNLVINDAGSDFSSAIAMESTVYLGISSASQWDNWGGTRRSWRINVRREDINWNNDLKLEIARAGDGSWWYFYFYGSIIYDGISYQTVANNSTYFFRGRGLLGDVPIRLRLSGFSLTQGANDYETNVVFTIYGD